MSANGLTCKHVHAVHAKLARRLLLGCRAKTIEPGGDVHVFQADPLQIRNELCLLQSAGDSTGPQVNVAADILRDLHIECYVSEMQPAASFENPHNLTKPEFLLGNEIEDAI